MWLERALTARPSEHIDADEAAIRAGLSRAQAAAVMLADSADNLTRAVDFYLRADDVDLAAAALRDVHNVGLAQRMVDVFSPVIARIPEDSGQLGHILASYGLAVGTSSGDYATARDALDRSLQLAEQFGDTPLKALALANMANVDSYHLKWESASSYARDALALLPSDDASVTAFRARQWAGGAAAARGQLQEGLAHFDTLCQGAERRHDTGWLAQGLIRKAQAHCISGDWERAEQAATDAINRIGDLQFFPLTSTAYFVRLQAAALTADRDRAEQVMTEVQEASRADVDPLSLLELHFATAGHLLGVPEHIATAGENLERIGERDDPPIGAIHRTTARALVAIERDDETMALEAHERLAPQTGTFETWTAVVLADEHGPQVVGVDSVAHALLK